MSTWAFGVDIGGTKIEVAQVDSEGKIVKRQRFPTDVHGGPKAIVDSIAAAVAKMCEEEECHPVGVGVGVAGQVDFDTGAVRFAPNLDWHDIPLQADLAKATGLPVHVTNDVRAGTYGEWYFGAGKGCDDLVGIFIGTGVGGGIVTHGKMLYGSSGTAGEIGHMIVDLGGPPCHCGSHGCVEAYAGGTNIARRAQEALKKDPQLSDILLELSDHQLEAITTRLIVMAYRRGDEFALELIMDARRALAAGVNNIINAINPRRIILGGGVVDGLPELVRWIDEDVRQTALEAALQPLEIVPAEYGNDANVVGAAAIVIRHAATHLSAQ